MSDARVQFLTTQKDPAGPGEEVFFAFTCPRGNVCSGLPILGRTNMPHDPQNQNGGRAHWTWDGNREAPTFTPSINCSGCWHGHVKAGRCVDGQGMDEPEFVQIPGIT